MLDLEKVIVEGIEAVFPGEAWTNLLSVRNEQLTTGSDLPRFLVVLASLIRGRCQISTTASLVGHRLMSFSGLVKIAMTNYALTQADVDLGRQLVEAVITAYADKFCEMPGTSGSYLTLVQQSPAKPYEGQPNASMQIVTFAFNGTYQEGV